MEILMSVQMTQLDKCDSVIDSFKKCDSIWLIQAIVTQLNWINQIIMLTHSKTTFVTHVAQLYTAFNYHK